MDEKIKQLEDQLSILEANAEKIDSSDREELNRKIQSNQDKIDKMKNKKNIIMRELDKIEK